LWIVGALNPRIIVELGVHSGNSYCALVQAVQSLSLPTRCFGIDHWRGDEQAGTYGEEVYADLKAYHDPRYGAFSTLVRSSFRDALPHFSDGSIDLLHIDGLHTYEAVHEDFTSWLPKMSARGVVLFHDINVHEADFGVWHLWQEVAARYPTFEFVHSSGLGLVYVGREPLSRPLQELLGAASDAKPRIRAYFARLGTSVLDRFALGESEAQLRALQADVGRQLAAADAAATAQQAESERVHAHVGQLEEQLRTAHAELARQVELGARQLERANAAAAAQQVESERVHAHVGKLEKQLGAAQAELARQVETTARQLETANAAAAAQQAESERAHVQVGKLEEQLRAARAEHARQVKTAARKLEAANAAAIAQQAESERMHAQMGRLEEQLRAAHAEIATQVEIAAREREEARAAATTLAEAVSQRDAICRIQRQQTALVSRLQRELAALENLRTSQHLAKLMLVRINPKVKHVIPITVKKFIKQRLLGLRS
jgi:hypothetical protein